MRGCGLILILLGLYFGWFMLRIAFGTWNVGAIVGVVFYLAVVLVGVKLISRPAPK